MGNEREPGTGGGGDRRFPAARLRRPAAPPTARPTAGPVMGPDVVDEGNEGFEPNPASSRSPFAPRSFAGGRVQVFGCTPAWLLVSLVVSVVLTLLLNLVFGLFA